MILASLDGETAVSYYEINDLLLTLARFNNTSI